MKVGFDDLPRALRNSGAWLQAADEDEKAMAIAGAVIETYGDLLPDEWLKFRRDGKIWRDHCAYQAALAAIRMSPATDDPKDVAPGNVEGGAVDATELVAALRLCKRVFDEALPKFDWGKSALDANAIGLLNEAMLSVPRILAKIGG